MKIKPPCKVSQETITFNVEELEPLLQGPALDVEQWQPTAVKLQNGQTMLIRKAKLSEAQTLLKMIRTRFINDDDLDQVKDFYDIVGARVYAEILGWYRQRLKDPYTFLGLIDGEVVAFGNGRLMNEDINISLHTMAFKRGLRAGAVMYYAKCHYCFEILGQEEFWATYESYNGLKRWGLGMAKPSYPWPDVQHELGGAKVFYLTRQYWDQRIKEYISQMAGAGEFMPASDELIKANEIIRDPDA
ncbi:N-acetyltransferase [bacterium]|nr:N-acetyltransferase [bacterium]